jgi:hypothetical protein
MFGAPSGALVGVNGAQSGLESRMSVFITPSNTGFSAAWATVTRQAANPRIIVLINCRPITVLLHFITAYSSDW